MGVCIMSDTEPSTADGQPGPVCPTRGVHHKLLVLDDQVAIGGSFNYTGPANQYNDENLFIIRNPAVAQHFRGEVEL